MRCVENIDLSVADSSDIVRRYDVEWLHIHDLAIQQVILVEQSSGQLGHDCGIGHDHHLVSGRIHRDID